MNEQREILFRGKRVDNGEWVEGNLIIYPSIIRIQVVVADYQSTVHEVDPETVGQYTGLKDKNGTKIFEGDKIRMGHEMHGTIEFAVGVFPCESCFRERGYIFEEREIIGNVHDKEQP